MTDRTALTDKQKMDRADFAARRHYAMYAPQGSTFDMLPNDARNILFHAMYAALKAMDEEWRPAQSPRTEPTHAPATVEPREG